MTIIFVDGKRKRKQKVHITWTVEEKRAVHDFFSQTICDNVYAKKAQCVDFLEHNQHIVNTGRDWRNIKAYVRNFCEKKA